MEKFVISEKEIFFENANPYIDLAPSPDKTNINPGIDKKTQKRNNLLNSLKLESL